MKKWEIIFLMIICYFIQINLQIGAEASCITYFSNDLADYGLWSYDPDLNYVQKISSDLPVDYQFSKDYRYLAFLANNQDRGSDELNSISLWVKDLIMGTEQVIESNFSMESNQDGKYVWFSTGELATIKPISGIATKDKWQLKLYRPDGELVWETGQVYEYLAHGLNKVVVRDFRQTSLAIFDLRTRHFERVPINPELVVSVSLSPTGKYLCYRTLNEIILCNLSSTENVYISIDTFDELAFEWSPEENYLIYQVLGKSDEDCGYHQKVYNVETGIKEFEISSNKKIYSSWSQEDDQLVLSVFENGWKLMIWRPSHYNLQTLKTGFTHQPRPVFGAKGDELYYVDYQNDQPQIHCYDIAQNLLRSILVGRTGTTWLNLSFISGDLITGSFEHEKVYWAGWAKSPEINLITLLCSYLTADEFSRVLKWSPVDHCLTYIEFGKNLYLIDQLGEMRQIYEGSNVSELFFNSQGNLLSFVDNTVGNSNLILYDLYQDELYVYPKIGEKLELVQWVDNQLLFFDQKASGINVYSLFSSNWDLLGEWKGGWWHSPKIYPAHFRGSSLWQLGSNIWYKPLVGDFSVITRLATYHPKEWLVWKNGWANWSPDDEKIIYNRQLVNNSFKEQQEKFEIWLMQRNDFQPRYICDGRFPQWLRNDQVLFLQNGDLYQVDLVSCQIVGYQTAALEEVDFTVSPTGNMIAVLAYDQLGRAGLYYYHLP